MRALDCQSFAGAFALGAVQAGFELVGKREHPGGFGVPSVEANRHLLGFGWETQVAPGPEWEPVAAELVFGNPPCSAFSVLGARRGMDDPISSCMADFADLAARVRPLVAVFESVPNALFLGRPLMRELRHRLEAGSGLAYDLHHVLHDGSRLGGPSARPRYFWVASRVPFGVAYPRLAPVDLIDVLEDLEGMAMTPAAQPYARPPTPWSEPLRRADALVDGHMHVDNGETERIERYAAALRDRGRPWQPGERLIVRARELAEIFGLDSLPPRYRRYVEATDRGEKFVPSAFEMRRWRYDKPGHVLDGGTPRRTLHPVEDRQLTLREAYRMQAFPDDWRLSGVLAAAGSTAFAFPGKGIPVVAGRWIATAARDAIAGRPHDGGHVRLLEPGEYVWADPDVGRFRRTVPA